MEQNKKSFGIPNIKTTRTQRVSQVISLILLVMVFWNFFKAKNKPAQALKDPSVQSSFEKGLDCHCDQYFVETPDLVVIKTLPEDRDETPHQKWILKAPTGHTILFAHNLKLCQKLDIKKGDRIKLGGEFKWTDKGGLVHWTHYDPQGKRPNGYVNWNNQTYCLKSRN